MQDGVLSERYENPSAWANLPHVAQFRVPVFLTPFFRMLLNLLNNGVYYIVSRLPSVSTLAVPHTEQNMPFPKGLTSSPSPASSRNSEPSNWEANVAACQGRNGKITIVSFHGLRRNLAAAKLMMSQ